MTNYDEVRMGHKRIMVADRNAKFLDKTREILEGAGVSTVAVEQGSRVMATFHQQQPEGALLNIDLPSVTGNDLCQQLKTINPTLPVVLMFNKAQDDMTDVAVACGADNFLVRPLKRTELLFCVRSMLSFRALLANGAHPDTDAKEPNCGRVSLDVFHRFLALEVRRADRYGFPLSVLSVKVDPLPETFDKRWHQALDQQLGPALSTVIRGYVRDIDLSAVPALRETLVAMPHTDADGAALVAERVRQKIAAQPYHFGRTTIQPTVSVGIAVVHGSQTLAPDLIHSARLRQRRASGSGGNRVFSE